MEKDTNSGFQDEESIESSNSNSIGEYFDESSLAGLDEVFLNESIPFKESVSITRFCNVNTQPNN